MVAKMTDKVELETTSGGVVYQSNAMVNAFYHCSVAEKRLLNLGISKVDVDASDWSKLEVTVSVAEYVKTYSKSARISNVKAEIVEAAEKLQRREIMFFDKGETVYQNILWQRRLNVEKGGYIKLSFTPNVARELTKLFHVGEYTAYTIEDTKELTSFAAFRLYEMAMQFIDLKTGKGEVYKIPVEKLRIILLGEGNEKYKTPRRSYSVF
jgi:plasmid replication initiation protein